MSQLEKEAKRLHTHTVVYNADSDEEDVAVRAMLGQTTRSIAEARGLSNAQVQYRIKKAGLVGGRAAYRNGATPLSKYVYRIGRSSARKIVQRDIAPKFVPFQDR